MKNDRATTQAGDIEVERNLYPHLKLTRERFPRILATRVIEEDGAEYFGPFLTKTSVRIIMDYLNRKFRLRTCDIPIDGSFPIPCTQYYRKRCLAPCVSSICDDATYQDHVSLARLFLANDRKGLRGLLRSSMAESSDQLDFEAAATSRDLLESIDRRWNNPRLNIWLDDTIDTIATEESDDGTDVYLVTQRDRYVLGRKVFTFPSLSADDALYEVISGFYQIGLPRQIRVYREFADRKNVESLLSERFQKPVMIKVVRHIDQRITARRALHNTRAESELDRVKRRVTPDEISGELKRIFSLAKAPGRIEGFDVAHISGSNFVAARSVWQEGRFVSADFGFEISEESSELAALGDFVRSRISETKDTPDLVLLDGGKTQINAVSRELNEAGLFDIPLIGAVKPAGRHSAVSHFLLPNGNEIGFDPDNPAHGVLQLLRDEAHDLANRVHRDLRDMGHYYELAALLPSSTEEERRHVIARAGTIRKLVDLSEEEIRATFDREVADRVLSDLSLDPADLAHDVRPLIVPLRFVAENGNAGDLIPIEHKV